MAHSLAYPSEEVSSSPARKQRNAFGLFTVLLWVQGLYYFATGLWPLVDIRSFQQVTGPKTDHLVTGLEADHWLVMTVGVLIMAVGFALLVAAVRRSRPVEIAALAVAAGVGLTAIDVIYVARQVISPVYLVDAAIEVLLVVAWSIALHRDSRADASARRMACQS